MPVIFDPEHEIREMIFTRKSHVQPINFPLLCLSYSDHSVTLHRVSLHASASSGRTRVFGSLVIVPLIHADFHKHLRASQTLCVVSYRWMRVPVQTGAPEDVDHVVGRLLIHGVGEVDGVGVPHPPVSPHQHTAERQQTHGNCDTHTHGSFTLRSLTE